MRDCVLALTTVPGHFDAASLAQDLVAAGVAACVTILPGVRSVYTWNGATHVDQEQQLVIKTVQERIPELWDRLRARHPFDVPEFLVVPIIDGSEPYLAWVRESVQARSPSS